MKIKILGCLIAMTGALLISATNGFSFGSIGDDVNTACAPEVVYTSGDCALCHLADRSASTPEKDAASAGGTTLTDFFCPSDPAPTCTDGDGDGYAIEGGDCGPVDCNDNAAAIYPGAVENCTDGIDNNCNSLIDDQDPAAVGCFTCTDSDGDGYAIEGGDCGPVDCDDNAWAINPGAVDIADNGIDENCDGADTVTQNQGNTINWAACTPKQVGPLGDVVRIRVNNCNIEPSGTKNGWMTLSPAGQDQMLKTVLAAMKAGRGIAIGFDGSTDAGGYNYAIGVIYSK
ncbi:MAG: putative metal-binding motif-containing protein [Desulfobulbaceae bacterium]|nr:putative metal-binding motif-containing protein [Desulfobulbaceae bacterium]